MKDDLRYDVTPNNLDNFTKSLKRRLQWKRLTDADITFLQSTIDKKIKDEDERGRFHAALKDVLLGKYQVSMAKSTYYCVYIVNP